jgi:PAS domain S-box-containing protein
MIELTKLNKFIRRLGEALEYAHEMEKFLPRLANLFVEQFHLTKAQLAVLDEQSGRYFLRASSDAKEMEIAENKVFSLENVVNWLPEKRMDETLLQLPAAKTAIGEQHLLSLPLRVGGKMIAVLNLGPKLTGEDFTAEEISIFSHLAYLLAGILASANTMLHLVGQAKHHQSILDDIASGIITVDAQGKITTFNRSAEKILGFKQFQVLGKEVQMLQGNLANLLLETLQEGKSYRREEIHILPDNIIIGVSTSQFSDKYGAVMGAVCVFADLAKIKENQERAKRENLEALWEIIATSLSHEVKNSLVSTKLLGELLPKKYADEEYRQSFFKALNRETKRLDDFTDRLASFAGLKQPNFMPLKVSEVVDAALAEILQKTSAREIVFRRKFGKNLPPVSCDYTQLKEAFTHIIENAVEAMPAGGTLTISAEVKSADEIAGRAYRLGLGRSLSKQYFLSITFSDTGKGIAEEYLEKVFEPFFTTKPGKMGLGLAYSQRVIENHKGFIDADCQSGETSVRVSLPVLAATSQLELV